MCIGVAVSVVAKEAIIGGHGENYLHYEKNYLKYKHEKVFKHR
jgi:hypothetical protein